MVVSCLICCFGCCFVSLIVVVSFWCFGFLCFVVIILVCLVYTCLDVDWALIFCLGFGIWFVVGIFAFWFVVLFCLGLFSC